MRAKQFLPGARIGAWEIVGPSKTDKYGHRHWLCKCTLCNKERYVDGSKLRDNGSTSCGCDRPTKIAKKRIPRTGPDKDFRGMTIGKLYVLDEPPYKNGDHWIWKCQCTVCGKEHNIRSTRLNNEDGVECDCEKGRKSNSENLAVGDRFGFWEVVEGYELTDAHRMFLCKCRCGTTKRVRGAHLVDNQSLSCGCAPRLTKGKLIGKYRLVEQVGPDVCKIPSVKCLNTETNEYEIVTKHKLLKIVAGYDK